MSLIVLLFVLGLVFLALEVILPGAVAGIVGGILMLVAVALVYSGYGASYGTMALVGALVAGAGCIAAELWWLPRSKWALRFTVRETSGKPVPPVAPVALVGKQGRTLTILAPSGYVEVEGRSYEAVSRSGLLQKGVPIFVESIDQFKVTVQSASS